MKNKLTNKTVRCRYGIAEKNTSTWAWFGGENPAITGFKLLHNRGFLSIPKQFALERFSSSNHAQSLLINLNWFHYLPNHEICKHFPHK